jgi:hypothetical protein
VVVTALALAAAGAVVYARAELVDGDAFSDRTASTLDDPGVRVVVADQLTEAIATQVASSYPALRPLVQRAARSLSEQPEFRLAVRRALERRHAQLIGGDREFVLAVDARDIGLVQAVRDALPPLVASRVPQDVRLRIAALDATDAELRLTRALVDAADLWWAFVAAAALAVVACALAAGGARSAALDVGLAVAGAGAIVAVSVVGLGSLAASEPAGLDEGERDAIRTLWSALFGDLRTAGLVAAGIGLVVAVGAAASRPRRRPRGPAYLSAFAAR